MIDLELFLSNLSTDLRSRKKDWKYYDNIHEEISKLYEQVSYHSEFGKFPSALFEKACPNQTPEEFTYNKETYRQKTKASWDKAVSSTFRVWNEQNYNIDYMNEEQKEYFTFLYPYHGNFETWFKDVIHPTKLADPNGVVSVFPMIPMKTVETENGIETVVNQSEAISPVCKYFDAADVWIFRPDFCMLKLEEKSVIKEGGKEKKEGLVFLVYTEQDIYKVTQTGDKSKYNFDFSLYYNHAWDYLPCFKLKGIPQEMIYHSYFMGAVPFLEDAILTDANFRAVKHRVAYPTRWYYSDNCNECNGDKYIEDLTTGEKHTCSSCRGSGKRMTFSPFRDYEIPLPENNIQSDLTQLPTPPFGSETPDTTSLEFLKKEVQDLTEQGFASVNIDVTNKVNGQTATESKIDREEFFSLLTKISSELFELMENLYDAQGWMRWGKSYEKIQITKPTEFTIRSAESLTEEFKNAVDAKLPDPYKKKVLMENLKIRFSGDEGMQKVLKVVSAVDPYMTISDQDLNLKKSNGLVALWECVLHDRIYTFIADQVNQKEKFLEGDIYKDIKPALETMAKEKATELTPKTRSAEDILNGMAK